MRQFLHMIKSGVQYEFHITALVSTHDTAVHLSIALVNMRWFLLHMIKVCVQSASRLIA